MFTQFLITVFYSNKSFQNPILGKMSCEVLKQSFYECKRHHAFKSKNQACLDLKYLMTECYSNSKPEEVNQLIMNEFRDAYITAQFFNSRGSIIGEKLFGNSWAVFYNKGNLAKYQKYMQKQKPGQGIIDIQSYKL